MHTIILLTGDRLCVSELPVWRPAKPNSGLRIGQNIIIIFIYWVARCLVGCCLQEMLKSLFDG